MCYVLIMDNYSYKFKIIDSATCNLKPFDINGDQQDKYWGNMKG